MTIHEYEQLLADLIERKVITLDEGAVLLQRFLRGDFEEDGLPLPLAQAQQKDDDSELLLLFLAFLPRTNTRITLNNRRNKRNAVRSRSEERMIALAMGLAEGTISVQEWHIEMRQLVGGSITAQWIIGNGRFNAAPNMDNEIVTQYQYLYRYATELHALGELGRQRSEDYIAHRSLGYLGTAWAAWFMGNESVGGGDGYISEYRARDDRFTCQPCFSARGFYALNSGPWPGQLCLGGGACRCERVVIYAPEIARQFA